MDGSRRVAVGSAGLRQVEESGVRLERDLPDVVEALENLFLFVDEVAPHTQAFLIRITRVCQRE